MDIMPLNFFCKPFKRVTGKWDIDATVSVFAIERLWRMMP